MRTKINREKTVSGLCVLIGASLFITVLATPLLAQSPKDDASPVPQVRSRRVEESRRVEDDYFAGLYRDFYNNYRLRAEDEIAVRVVGQPDFSVERVKVSPVGCVYHPLLGDVEVAGMTISELKAKLTEELQEYLVNPRVSVSLLDANGAKIGVLGEVLRPGIQVMTRPMRVNDAIANSGGITDTGNKSNVSLVRQTQNGGMQVTKINVKRILEGKASPEENPVLQPGDTIVVSGNFKKQLGYIMSMSSFANFVAFLTYRIR